MVAGAAFVIAEADGRAVLAVLDDQGARADRGPNSITLRAARGRLLSSASILASPSLISRMSTPLSVLSRFSRCPLIQ